MNLMSKRKNMKLGFVLFGLLGIFAITLSVQDTFAQTEDKENKKHENYQNDDIGVTLESQEDRLLIDGLQNTYWPYENTKIGVNLEYPETGV